MTTISSNEGPKQTNLSEATQTAIRGHFKHSPKKERTEEAIQLIFENVSSLLESFNKTKCEIPAFFHRIKGATVSEWVQNELDFLKKNYKRSESDNTLGYRTITFTKEEEIKAAASK